MTSYSVVNDPALLLTTPGRHAVYGVTTMHGQVSVVRYEVPEVEVYAADTLVLERTLAVKGLLRPYDLTSSPKHSCLYIADIQQENVFRDSGSLVHRIDLNGNDLTWSLSDVISSLSVGTGGQNVIVVCDAVPKLREYTTDGHLIREICLQDGVLHPWHALQLTSGQFIVSHGWTLDAIRRVCIVDDDGRVVRSYGGGTYASDLGKLNVPRHFVVDRHGCVLVSEVHKNRVLRINRQLNEANELVSLGKKNMSAFRLCLDEAKERLFVAAGDRNSRTGVVLVYQMSLVDKEMC